MPDPVDFLTGPALLAFRKINEIAFLHRVLKVYLEKKSYRLAAKELGIGTRTMIRLIKKYPELQVEERMDWRWGSDIDLDV